MSSVLQRRMNGLARLAALGILLSAACPGWAAPYHVSAEGSDAADGRSPETAWASLDRVNAAVLAPGDSVLFRRGDQWRGQLRPCSGDETAPVTYGAYGEGEKPVLMGSVAKNRPEDWMDLGNGVWSTLPPQANGPELLLPPAAAESSGWRLHTEGGASARMTGAGGGLDVECAAPGTIGSHIQCYTASFSVQQGEVYRLAFRARSSVPVLLEAPTLMRSGPPWSSFGAAGARPSFPVGEEWGTFTSHYTANQTAEDARLTFFLGTVLPAGAALSLEALSFREGAADGFLVNDVGNIIFDGEQSWGVKVWEPGDLDTPGEYWYDEAAHVVRLVSPGNPATLHTEIECAVREHLIDQGNRHHVVYDGLALRYGAAHGVGGGNVHHITVRNCDISWIGGGDQMGGDRTVRFGNGVEFWGTAHDCLVERCRLWEIYDAALTNQSGGPNTPQRNLTYRYNLIWNSEYSFEYWNRPEASETEDTRFEHNTCFDAGSGWGHAQRPDPSGRHLCFYTSPARARGIIIRGNIFCGALGNAFYAPTWPREALDALEMDRNCWWQPEGDLVSVDGRRYPMAAFDDYRRDYAKEPNSLTAEPGVGDAAARDYRLTAGSPCVDAGDTPAADTDFEGVPVPQGAAPDMGAHERRKDS